MLILYVGTSLVIWVIFNVMSSMIDGLKLADFDKQLGGVFGLVKGLVLCSVITLFAVSLFVSSGRSHGADVDGLLPYVPMPTNALTVVRVLRRDAGWAKDERWQIQSRTLGVHIDILDVLLKSEARPADVVRLRCRNPRQNANEAFFAEYIVANSPEVVRFMVVNTHADQAIIAQ